MDGAAWRFEQQLDLDSQADYEADHFYDNEPDFDYNECSFCGGDIDPQDGRCFDCGKDAEGNTPDYWGVDPMEDQWLDGSWEE